MSEQKMRDALEHIKTLTEIPFAYTKDEHEVIYKIACEALAEKATQLADFSVDDLIKCNSQLLDCVCILINGCRYSPEGRKALVQWDKYRGATHKAKRGDV